MAEPSERSGAGSRKAKVREVVLECIRRRPPGAPIDHEPIVTAHAELMPELGEELRKLQLIDKACGQDDSQATAGDPTSLGTDSPPHTPNDGLRVNSFPGYEIVRRIHRGGQGVVYQALQTATKRKVAIKVMREGPFAGPHDEGRFEREIQILGSLNHPHIVTIHDSGSAAGHFYFVMDYVPGQPLDVYMAGAERSIEETLLLFEKICKAVNAAHVRGVIHRDLKPGNIRIDAEGEPHILDFGLAKIATGEANAGLSQTMTATGQFVGSLPWAAPEQVDGSPGRIDLRTDVYSLGVVLYQMLTGRFPYDVVGNVREVMDNIVNAEPTRPSTINRRINDEIETIVLKSLNKEQERRYQIAGELAREVDRYLRGEPIEAKRDSTWYVLKKTIRRYRVPTAVAVVFAVLIAGFAVAMSVMYRRANREAVTANRIEACMESMFTELGSPQDGARVTVREILDRGAGRVADELKDEPAVQARLMEKIAARYARLGLYKSEALWLERALAVRRDVLDEDDRNIASRLYALGSAYNRSAAYARAEAVLREALRLQRKYSNGRTDEVLPTLRTLAEVFLRQGAYDEAERVFHDALQVCGAVHGKPDPDAVLIMLRFAAFLENRGEYQQAKGLLEEALTAVRQLHQGDDRQVVLVLKGLASVLQSMGLYDEALPFAREAVAMARRLLPGDHLTVIATWDMLGLLLKDMGDYAAAESLIRRSLDMHYRMSGGQDTRGVAYSQHCLAKVYSDAGEWVKAEAACRKALELHLKVLPSDDKQVARPMTHLGRILVHLGRYAEAEPLLREALEIRQKRKPPGHWKTAKTESVLGSCMAGLGRHQEAERFLLESYPVIAKDRGPRHRRTLEAIRRVINLYESWGNPDKAAQWRAKLPESERAESPPG